MIFRRIILCISLLVLPMFSLLAQERELGNWMMYFGQNRLSEKWSIHTEIQYRNHSVTPNIEQLLLRTGLNYHIKPNLIILLGYGYIPSFDEDAEFSNPTTSEHRIFQELNMTQAVGQVKFNHRYRIEQRWVNGDYRNRLRYRLLVTIPFKKDVVKTPFLALYDEIFVNTKVTVFDRNRSYLALGYNFSKMVSAQVGILNQQVNAFAKWYLQFAVFYNPKFYGS